jgi:DMSO/TMAO reductase YedYZ molybdopterin-dependent catalytic subunit
MKKMIITSILILILSVSFFNCKDDKKVVTYDNGNNGTIDVTTMATPSGGKLKPAEEGPVRSALGEPKIDLTAFQLEITGLVDSSFSLTWEEIQALPAAYSDTILMYCVEGWEVWGNWKGVLIKDLLDKAHIQPEGEYILFGCVDGYTTSLPISYLEKYNAMVAYQVNAFPLKEHDGFPLRLIAFGKYGYKWAKWVNKLEVMSQSQIGYWERQGYSDRADVPIKRRSYYEGENAKPLEY